MPWMGREEVVGDKIRGIWGMGYGVWGTAKEAAQSLEDSLARGRERERELTE